MNSFEESAAEDLASRPPSWIDAQLNHIGYEHAKLIARVDSLRAAARHARSGRRPDPIRASRFEAQAEQYGPQICGLTEAMKPYHDEYDRRGGWDRAYLVQNTGGHVHSSINCASCYPTTQYAWLTDYSGKTEAEIVYAAGELACTICYPSAPVDVLKRIGEIRRVSDIDREKRASEKAAKARVAAAAAVVDPTTGKTLYKTERAATNEIGSTLWDLRWYGEDHPSGADWKKTVAKIVGALAVKRGVDTSALMAEFEAKADGKFNTDARRTLREVKRQRGEIAVDDLVPGLQAWIEANGMPT